MNFLLMLSGGLGTRMIGATMPKQYMEVGGKPIIMYALKPFLDHEEIDGIAIVAHDMWRPLIARCMDVLGGRSKLMGFANPGQTRQNSIYQGLRFLLPHAQPMDRVMIHDAVRPLVSRELISASFAALSGGEADGVMPVVRAKDTFYYSSDGRTISGLINRTLLYAGQAPETFLYGKYKMLHDELGQEEIERITGSTEIAHRGGMKIALIPGEDKNIKITTQHDLDIFRMYLEEGSR